MANRVPTPSLQSQRPIVQRVRLRYAKRGRLRFSSHRDFQRALERALRRVEAPMAYSAGFNPHPKISYANAAATGASSEAEYVELALIEQVDPEQFRARLDAALPAGLDIVEVVTAHTPNLVERLQGSVWLIELPGCDPADVAEAVAVLLAADHVEVTRTVKSGQRVMDVRAALLDARLVTLAQLSDEGAAVIRPRGAQGDQGDCAILRLVVQHCTPAVRPDDILVALRTRANLAPQSPPRLTRLAQGPLNEQGNTVGDPLAVDREAVGA